MEIREPASHLSFPEQLYILTGILDEQGLPAAGRSRLVDSRRRIAIQDHLQVCPRCALRARKLARKAYFPPGSEN